jgi:hypothetical protein
VIPKAPIQAQILIGLFAVLAIAYGASIIRLDGASNGTRGAVPGQLIVVSMSRAWYSLISTDPWVVAPISVRTSPTTRAYFIALKPGRAKLQAYPTSCSTCLSVMWQVEVMVWPSG